MTTTTTHAARTTRYGWCRTSRSTPLLSDSGTARSFGGYLCPYIWRLGSLRSLEQVELRAADFHNGVRRQFDRIHDALFGQAEPPGPSGIMIW